MPRSCFGELALLYSSPRAATVRSTTQCRLWVMDRSAYAAIRRNFVQTQNAERHRLLESVPSLKRLPVHHRAMLVDALKQVGGRGGGDSAVNARAPAQLLNIDALK